MQDEAFISCSCCGLTLPADEFQFSRSAPGSMHRARWCRSCNNARVRSYYRRLKEEEPEKWAEQQRRKSDRLRVKPKAVKA